MDNNIKYYTPALNDLYIGYHFEIFEDFDYYPEKSWHPFIYGEEGTDNVENMQSPLARPEKDWYGKIRTKYLDRKDIESLGWAHFEFNYPNPREIQSFKKGNYFLAFFKDGRIAIILQDITTNEVASDYYQNGQLYLGSCPSINELRTIEKLLGI